MFSSIFIHSEEDLNVFVKDEQLIKSATQLTSAKDVRSDSSISITNSSTEVHTEKSLENMPLNTKLIEEIIEK